MRSFNWIVLLLFGTVYGQTFEVVNYIGACGSVDWTKEWTDFTPIAEEYPEVDIPIQGTINKNTTLFAVNTYKLVGKVYVTNNATLYIEPGTIIRAEYKSALVITRGAKIRALGTKSKPIVMTSAQTANNRNKGDWSGLVILGNAPVNTPTGTGIAEGDLDPAYNVYGGKEELDNSGVLNYVRVEFAGRRINKDHEFNGITFYGVGSRTEVDYIMSSYSGDDGIQFFGGSVNCKHLVSFQSADDCFEYSEGYHGRQQFGISLRHFNLGDVSGSRSIDGQSSMAGIMHMEIPTTATISNFTLISPEIFYEQGSNANIKDAVHYESGAAYSMVNSLVVGFPIGIAVNGSESIDMMQNGIANVRNTLFVGCSKLAVSEPKTFDINSWFVSPEFSNVFRPKADANKLFVQPFSIFKPDFSTLPNALIVKPDYQWLNKNLKSEKSDKEPSNFLGAFDKHDWTVGWTSFKPDVEAVGETILEGNIAASMTLSADKNYLLKGNVVVKNGVTLTIEPGTLILCDAASHASLTVEPLGELYAIGEANSPIVFRSSNAVGKKTPGDWKGITILGNSFLVPSSIKTARQVNSSLPEVSIAEGGFEGQVTLQYVRLEYAGYAAEKSNQAALHLIARSKLKTILEYVQASYSASDGFQFTGGDFIARHLLAYNNVDDDLVCSSGYHGTCQYVFNWRQPIAAALNGACSVEINGCAKFCYPDRVPVLSNFTVIGPNRKGVQQINQNYRSAVLLQNGGSVQLVNSLLVAYPAALEICGSESNFYAISGITYFGNTITSDISNTFKTDEADPSLVQKKILSPEIKKMQRVFSELKLAPSITLDLEYLPSEGSPCLGVETIDPISE